VHRIALGPLAGNPFPDATPEFFETIGRALSLGLNHPISIATPLTSWHKDEVVRQGTALGVPLDLTLSCMNPTADDRHCGACSKCRERRDAFGAAGVEDTTHYAVQWRR
jgi:7-cyano-7-deazaguanine synthase